MAATSNIAVLLKYFASKQNSAFVVYKDFADYIKRYAQHNVEEVPDLVSYLGNPESAIDKELIPLIKSKQVALIDQDPSKKQIFVTGFFNSKFADRYKEIQSNPAVPFPTISDLPKQAPLEVLNKQNSQDIVFNLMKKQDKNDRQLYAIIIPNNVPAVIFPGNIPISILVDSVMGKIRRMLKKEEYHDYYLKKLRIANPGKEMTSKNFFTDFVNKPDVAMRSLESAGDSFYFWNQLCYFIKQDYEKVKDFNFDIKIEDARQTVKNDKNMYNLIFLDAFTPSKCPCLWTYEFFKRLYEIMEDDGMLLTYSSSAQIRSAMIEAGFEIGNIYNKRLKKFQGTVAVKIKSLISHPLSEDEIGLLNSRAGIFYRDKDLNAQNEAIIKAHINEVNNSERISSSQFLKARRHNGL